jgi:hypothetical protein
MSKPISYSFYYKDSLVLRYHREQKSLEQFYEYFNVYDKKWCPIPSNQILSMNIGKYRISEQDVDSYLKESCSRIFQKATSQKEVEALPNGLKNDMHSY